jgi:hypothetical protein
LDLAGTATISRLFPEQADVLDGSAERRSMRPGARSSPAPIASPPTTGSIPDSESATQIATPTMVAVPQRQPWAGIEAR